MRNIEFDVAALTPIQVSAPVQINVPIQLDGLLNNIQVDSGVEEGKEAEKKMELEIPQPKETARFDPSLHKEVLPYAPAGPSPPKQLNIATVPSFAERIKEAKKLSKARITVKDLNVRTEIESNVKDAESSTAASTQSAVSSMSKAVEKVTSSKMTHKKAKRKLSKKYHTKLQKWHRRAVFGKWERAEGLHANKTHRAWLDKQMEDISTELPACILEDIERQAFHTVERMCGIYQKQLGRYNPITLHACDSVSKMAKRLNVTTKVQGIPLNNSEEEGQTKSE